MPRSALTLLTVALLATLAPAVVLHDDLQPAEHPVEALVGRWGYNASCVAIGPDLVLTTTHQGGGVGSTVVVGGQSYTVAEVYACDVANADLRVARLSGELAWWTAPQYESAVGSEVLVGGYGRSRGAELTGAAGVYGYAWRSEGNTTLRWGTNTIDETQDVFYLADFDGPDAPGATEYEAAVAEYDSGSGWFVRVDGKWRLAGLTRGAEHAISARSIFATAEGQADPDRLYAVDLSTFSTWLSGELEALLPVPGDVDRDGDVDAVDLEAFAAGYAASGQRAGWSSGNFDGDGDVDLVDLGLLSQHYGYGLDAVAAAGLDFQADLAAAMVPEPATGLLLLAVAPLLKRRRLS